MLKIYLILIFSFVKCLFISTCFVLLYCTWLCAMWMVTLYSQYTFIDSSIVSLNSIGIILNQSSSHIHWVIAHNSTIALDFAAMHFFLFLLKRLNFLTKSAITNSQSMIQGLTIPSSHLYGFQLSNDYSLRTINYVKEVILDT